MSYFYGMRLSLASFICLLCCPVTQGLTQSDIDHWEAVAQDGSVWSYLVPSGQPTPFWKDNVFNDEMWPVGPSGFGYGDGDGQVTVSDFLDILSVYGSFC